jgi:hypothetical protein
MWETLVNKIYYETNSIFDIDNLLVFRNVRTTSLKMNISYYGGVSTIVPLPLNIFQKMVEDSYKAAYTPQPQQVKQFFERSNEIAVASADEKAWYQGITHEALNWLG